MRLNDIIRSMKDTLQGTRLRNPSPYSDLYILFRAVASVMTEQEFSLSNLFNLFYVSTATGTYLDRRAADFGLSRLSGSPAVGYVLVRSPLRPVTLPRGLILNSASSLLQYTTQGTLNLYAGLLEVPLPIQSNNLSSEGNLIPGTLLHSNFYPDLVFTIGRYRTPSGEAKGALTGGESGESDIDFRLRLLAYLRRGSPCSVRSLTVGLQSLGTLGKVYLAESNPVAGYMTVYVSSSDSLILDSARDYMNKYKAAGTAYRIAPIAYIPVSISIEVTLSSPPSGDTSEVIGDLVRKYIDSLPISSPFIRMGLENYVSQSDTRIWSVKVLYPSDLPPQSGGAYSVTSVDVVTRIRT